LAYFPAISLAEGQRVIFNFGLRPFRYRGVNLTHGSQYQAINEPESYVKNYH
jgi:hypothetical protein